MMKEGVFCEVLRVVEFTDSRHEHAFMLCCCFSFGGWVFVYVVYMVFQMVCNSCSR